MKEKTPQYFRSGRGKKCCIVTVSLPEKGAVRKDAPAMPCARPAADACRGQKGGRPARELFRRGGYARREVYPFDVCASLDEGIGALSRLGGLNVAEREAAARALLP